MLSLLNALKVMRAKDLMVFRFDRQEQFEKEMKKVNTHLQCKRQPQTVLTAWLVEILPRVLGYHL
jgi:hypothetical protein